MENYFWPKNSREVQNGPDQKSDVYINLFLKMGYLPQKMCMYFWAYFIRMAKRNNFVEVFYSILALFRREN
jgi:hypothetical protein